MDIRQFLPAENEKPLERIVEDGGFCSVFRTIGCIGDSLSSGEFESTDENGKTGYHDYFEYSWGQYIARAAGIKVYNFSKGGMTAKNYVESFAESKGYWSPDLLCQAYIIALGVNDQNHNVTLGGTGDIDKEDYTRCADTFAGNMGKIILRLKEMQPQARFFLVTRPHGTEKPGEKRYTDIEAHAELMYRMAEFFPYTYVIDLTKYGPVYDEEFRRCFYLGSHMNPAGYCLTGKMIASYIDYIVRHNFEDFAQIGFIGQPFHNGKAKW